MLSFIFSCGYNIFIIFIIFVIYNNIKFDMKSDFAHKIECKTSVTKFHFTDKLIFFSKKYTIKVNC